MKQALALSLLTLSTVFASYQGPQWYLGAPQAVNRGASGIRQGSSESNEHPSGPEPHGNKAVHGSESRENRPAPEMDSDGPPKPKVRPSSTDLNFDLSCPPEETFRCIPYLLTDKTGKRICNIGVGYLNPKLLFDCGSIGQRRKCITWKKDECKTDYNTCLVTAFWDWLGIDDCNDAASLVTTAKPGSSIVLLDIPMMDIPMMDDVDLEPTCTLQDNIISNLKQFSSPKDLETYWRSLFKNGVSSNK